MLEAAGGLLAWLGASLVVLSDGRRGQALGVALAGVALAGVAFPTGGVAGSAAIALGGLVAAAGRLVAGPAGWGIMPAGSTPRLVLALAGGLLALWLGLGVMSGGGGGLRFAVITVIAFSTARVLSSEEPSVACSGVALIALAVAAAAGLSGATPAVLTYFVGGAVAAASAWIPIKAPSAA